MDLSSNFAAMKRGKDFSYGWVIVATCFTIAAISFGAVYSFGVFLTPLRESFGWTSAAISGAYALAMFTYTAFGVFAGWGVDKYGPKITAMLGGFFLGLGLILTSQVNVLWQLYVTYGLIGVGMSAGFVPLMTTVSRWFAERRGLVLGIVSAGIGVGPLIVAPLASYLVSTEGWRFAFLVIGFIAGFLIPAALLLKRSAHETGELPNGEMYDPNSSRPEAKATKVTSRSSEFSLKEAISTEAFWLLGIVLLMIGMGLQMVLVHVVAYSESKGMSPMAAATVLSTVSGASIAGRIVMGTVSDRIGRKKALAICVFMEGIMIFWLMGASVAWMLFVFGAIFGFFYGGHSPQLPALTGEILGLRHMGAILGATGLFWGVGGALGPVLAGHILDITGSYNSAFIIGAVAMCSAAIAAFLIKAPQKEGEA